MVNHVGKLVDIHGDVLVNARGESKAITGKHPVVPQYDHWSNHPSNGITPARLSSLLRSAEDGDIRAQIELYEDILDKDPTIAAAVETRCAAVMNKAWDVVANEDAGEEGQQQAAWVRKTLESLSRAKDRLSGAYAAEWLSFNDLLSHLLMASYYGFAGAELHWSPRTWRVEGARTVSQKHFIWGQTTRRGSDGYNPYELRIRTVEDPADGVILPLYKYIVHLHRGKGSLPPRAGLGRTLTWWYIFKNYAVKSMILAAERHGMPLRIGKYDSNSETDRAIMERAVRELGTDAAAVIDKGSEILFPEVKPSPGDIHERIMTLVNAEISKAVLGHTATTEATPGKLGSEDQAMQVQYYRIERDARALEETINLQIVEPMALWNDGKCLCYFKIRYEPEEDMNARAERMVKIATLAPVRHADVYEGFDLTAPAPGDETTQTHLPKDPMSAALSAALANAAPTPTRKANAPQPQKKKLVMSGAHEHSQPGGQLTLPLTTPSTPFSPYTTLYSQWTRSERDTNASSTGSRGNS